MKGSPEAIRSFQIERYRAGTRDRATDRTTVEEPLEIRAGGQTLCVTMRTPGHDFELAAGFLLAEGIVSRPQEIVRIEHCRDVRSPEEEGNVVLARVTASLSSLESARRLLLTTSSCGLCGKGSIEAIHRRFTPVPTTAPVAPEVLVALPGRLRRGQTTFDQTGGLHAAAIFTRSGRLRILREDVGRHNAVDKAIGRLFLDGRVPLSDAILLVSGRASFEIVQKALAASVPVVAAVSAPSSLAVELARESNMTLVGFLREGGLNLYSGTLAAAPGVNAPAATG
ncbi:MAG: formate dehydrogenase accessory sulfurtransferase FdhD [Thermoanaerobaculia bacterium]